MTCLVELRKPPAYCRSSAGGKRHRGGGFFGYFLFADEKKVTSCRATPDGFAFLGILNLNFFHKSLILCLENQHHEYDA